MVDQNHDVTAQTEAHGAAQTSHDTHGYDHLYQDPAFWVALAIISFFALMIWKKIPAMMAKILDGKTAEIAAQLDNARILREEASALLAKYQRDQRGAEKQAAEMIERAEAEAKLLAEEARTELAELTRRRTKLAEQKIAQAEANALKQIRQIAVRAAAAAARDLIADNLKKADRDALIDSGIEKLDSQFH